MSESENRSSSSSSLWALVVFGDGTSTAVRPAAAAAAAAAAVFPGDEQQAYCDDFFFASIDRSLALHFSADGQVLIIESSSSTTTSNPTLPPPPQPPPSHAWSAPSSSSLAAAAAGARFGAPPALGFRVATVNAPSRYKAAVSEALRIRNAVCDPIFVDPSFPWFHTTEAIRTHCPIKYLRWSLPTSPHHNGLVTTTATAALQIDTIDQVARVALSRNRRTVRVSYPVLVGVERVPLSPSKMAAEAAAAPRQTYVYHRVERMFSVACVPPAWALPVAMLRDRRAGRMGIDELRAIVEQANGIVSAKYAAIPLPRAPAASSSSSQYPSFRKSTQELFDASGERLITKICSSLATFQVILPPTLPPPPAAAATAATARLQPEVDVDEISVEAVMRDGSVFVLGEGAAFVWLYTAECEDDSDDDEEGQVYSTAALPDVARNLSTNATYPLRQLHSVMLKLYQMAHHHFTVSTPRRDPSSWMRLPDPGAFATGPPLLPLDRRASPTLVTEVPGVCFVTRFPSGALQAKFLDGVTVHVPDARPLVDNAAAAAAVAGSSMASERWRAGLEAITAVVDAGADGGDRDRVVVRLSRPIGYERHIGTLLDCVRKWSVEAERGRNRPAGALLWQNRTVSVESTLANARRYLTQ